MRKKMFKLGVVFLLLTTMACYTQKKSKEIILEEGTLTDIKYLEIIDKNGIYYSDSDNTYVLNKGKKKELGFEILSKIKKKNEGYIVKNEKGKIGIVNSDFKSVVAFNYDKIINLGETDFILGENEGKKYLVNVYDYNMQGPYESITTTNNGKIIKIVSKGNINYLDKKGKEIPNLKNREIFFWRDNVALTLENEKYGLINLNNGKVTENKNSEIYFSKDNVLRKEGDNYYLNDEKIDIGRVYPTLSDVVIYDKNGKFALFNLRDLKHSNVTYDEVMFAYNNYIIVGKDGKYGIINKYDEKMPEFKYLYITPAGVDAFAGGTNEETGFVALIVGDKQVTDEKYESIENLVEGYYFGELKGKLILLDKNGKELLTTAREDVIYYNKDVLVLKAGDKEIVYSLN